MNQCTHIFEMYKGDVYRVIHSREEYDAALKAGWVEEFDQSVTYRPITALSAAEQLGASLNVTRGNAGRSGQIGRQALAEKGARLDAAEAKRREEKLAKQQ